MGLNVLGTDIPTNMDSLEVFGTDIDELEVFGVIVWKKQKYYYITFHANSGTGSMAKQTMPCGTAEALSANLFSKVGYLFQGWNPNASGDAVYTDGQKVTDIAGAGETLPLYAIWKAITYYVKYNANGGSGSMANQDFKYDAAENLNSNAFSRTGYLFAGWDVDGDGDADYGDGVSVKNLLSVNGGTVNFYAVWKAITWYVKFNANGGSGSMKNQTHTYDTELALTKNAFTRTNHKFLGWGTAPSGGVVYADQAAVKNLKSAHGAIQNLYAVWREMIKDILSATSWSGDATIQDSPRTNTNGAPDSGSESVNNCSIAIDVTNFKTLVWKGTTTRIGTYGYGNAYIRGGSSVGGTNYFNTLLRSHNYGDSNNAVSFEKTIDVSGITGNLYLSVYVFAAGGTDDGTNVTNVGTTVDTTSIKAYV